MTCLPLHSDTKLHRTNIFEQPVSTKHLTYVELILILIIGKDFSHASNITRVTDGTLIIPYSFTGHILSFIMLTIGGNIAKIVTSKTINLFNPIF